MAGPHRFIWNRVQDQRASIKFNPLLYEPHEVSNRSRYLAA